MFMQMRLLVLQHNQARKVSRNDGAAVLCLLLLQPRMEPPPGSSITAGTAETVSAANKQPSQKENPLTGAERPASRPAAAPTDASH